jgi:hypothetical protein
MITLPVDLLINLNDVTTDYQFLNESETDFVKNEVVQHIQCVNRRPNKNQWNSAWSELNSGDAPKYFKPRVSVDGLGVYRYKQKYIKSAYPDLENVFHDKIIEKIQNKMLTGIDCVVEFGCGTGHNLKKIKDRNPNVKIFGSDWTNASQNLLSSIGIPSWNFDMLSREGAVPDEIVDCNNVCFLTVGSMEQLGNNWKNFFDFMLEFKPTKSIHIEPIIEFYDENNSIDRLAIEYHNKRDYLNGFFDYLIDTNNLLSYQRISFGNSYNEGFNILELKYE